MSFVGNIGELSKRIKTCLYMGYPMWAEQYEYSDLENPVEHVVKNFFLGLIPFVRNQDPEFFGEGIYGITIKSQVILLIQRIGSLTGSPKTGGIQIDEVLMGIVDGSWSSVGGDDELAGGLPEYELRLKLISMISQYTDAVIQQIEQFYFAGEDPRLAIPFVVDFPYPYAYGYGYGYGLSGYGYGYGYEGTDDYFELIEQF